MSFGNLFGQILFGSLGFVAFIYGKKQGAYRALTIGLALMVYPYFVTSTLYLYGIGIALIAALFIFRD